MVLLGAYVSQRTLGAVHAAESEDEVDQLRRELRRAELRLSFVHRMFVLPVARMLESSDKLRESRQAWKELLSAAGSFPFDYSADDVIPSPSDLQQVSVFRSEWKFCGRCGRTSHLANICAAKTDINGAPLKGSASSPSVGSTYASVGPSYAPAPRYEEVAPRYAPQYAYSQPPYPVSQAPAQGYIPPSHGWVPPMWQPPPPAPHVKQETSAW